MRTNFSREATRPESFSSHIITITSKTGVGSSTTIKALERTLGSDPWKYVSGGSIMREFAASHGMSIEEFALYAKEHPEIDQECDLRLARYGKRNFTVLEARLVHAFVPHGFHVYLTCPIAVRAERRQRDFPDLSLAEVTERIALRDQHDDERYAVLYPLCLWPEDDYDLVIDTSAISPEETAARILENHREWQTKVTISSHAST